MERAFNRTAGLIAALLPDFTQALNQSGKAQAILDNFTRAEECSKQVNFP
jgi:hypothetical protein